MSHVLIVDDDRTTLKVIEKILLSMKLTADCTTEADQAQRWLKSRSYDLLITDANMPGLSGFNLIEIVRKNSAYNSMRILMITARNTKHDVERAFGAGADDYMIKPINNDLLRAKISSLFGGTVSAHEVFHGIELKDKVAWMNAFQICLISEDGVEMQSSVAMQVGERFQIESKMLKQFGPSLSTLEVASCERQGQNVMFTVVARFAQISPADRNKLAAWMVAKKQKVA